MPYNLPKPWDPGYALPDNVDEEGLERRAFVTKQMPRGTYDNPSVGDGGYDVPQYVLDEGYGQGTYTTKWVPGGTYGGPKILPWLNQHPQVTKSRQLPGGGRAVTMLSGFGDAELPAAFEDYGQKAAQILLSKVQAVPAQKRQAVLKQIMDKIDPSLWGRSQQIWKRYIAQGIPPAQAMPLAIGRAMSTGLAAEVVDTGLRRSAPQAKSLLGLGCYGCLAVLGEDTPADCDTTKGFSWVYGSAGVPGHWERTKAGASDVPFCKSGPPAGASTVDPSKVDVRDHATATKGDYVAVSPMENLADPIYFPKSTPTSAVRNFAMLPDIVIVLEPMADATVDALRKAGVQVKAELPASWRTWMRQELTTPADYKNERWQYKPDVPEPVYGLTHVLGIPAGTTIYEATGSYIPRAWVKWPVDGSTLGIYFYFEKLVREGPSSQRSLTLPAGANNPVVLKIWLSKIPPDNLPLLGQFANAIVQFFAKVVDVVVDAVKDLADLACDALNGPLSGAQGQAAGAAAAGAAGAPPQAGAIGAAIAQKACGGPPPAVPVVAQKSSLMTTLLLAGGAVAAVALLTRDK